MKLFSTPGLAWILPVTLLLSAGGCAPRPFAADRVRVLGYQAWTAGDQELARKYFQDAIDHDPADTKSHYYLGRINLEHLNNPGLARRHLEHAYELRRRHLDPELAIASGAPDPVVPWPTLPQITDQLAEAMYRQDHRSQLMALMDEAIKRHGGLADYLRKGRYLHKLGDNDGALQAFQRALAAALPGDPTVHTSLAEFYDSVGDREAAVTHLRKAYGIRPDESIAQSLRSHGIVPGPTIALPPGR